MQLINVTTAFVVETFTCCIEDLKVTIGHQQKERKRSEAENHVRIIHFNAISEKGVCYQVQVSADLYNNVS